MMMSQPPSRKLYNGCDPENTLLWPYRTNPLVLPGAKATKDPAPTMSYLRHHPNPMMRSSPSHYEWIPIDIAKKQQLADTILEKNIGNDKPNRKIVTKPYNTPIGLYSEQNIANTLNAQTGGFTPLRKTVVYDPSKSETFKALQEAEIGNHVQEVYTSPTPRVFSPTKTPNKLAPPTSYNYNPNRASPQPHPTAPHSKIDYGVSPEEIHQSHSFKRLMNMVMTDY